MKLHLASASASHVVLTLFFTSLLAQSMPPPIEFTPSDFDWASLPNPPHEEWGGRYINLSTHPGPYPERFYEIVQIKEVDGAQLAIIPFILGLGWQKLTSVAFGAFGLATTIKGCITSDGSPEGDVECAVGLASTIFSIGVNYKKSHLNRFLGWFGSGRNKWENSFLEDIDFDVFGKRSLETHQNLHDSTFHGLLQEISEDEPEFLGYANHEHHLGKRQEGDFHDLAPIFRVRHSELGHMDLSARHGRDEIRITAEYANFQELEKRQTFRHARFTKHLMEARFDSQARGSDPEKLHWNAKKAYPQIRNELKCFGDGHGKHAWRPGHVLSAQFFDKADETTFGYASLGILKGHKKDKAFSTFGARKKDLPLKVPKCAHK